MPQKNSESSQDSEEIRSPSFLNTRVWQKHPHCMKTQETWRTESNLWTQWRPGAEATLSRQQEDYSASQIKVIRLKVSLLVLLVAANHSWRIQWKQTDKHSTQELVYKLLLTKPSTCYNRRNEKTERPGTMADVCLALWSPNAQFNGTILRSGIEILFWEIWTSNAILQLWVALEANYRA